MGSEGATVTTGKDEDSVRVSGEFDAESCPAVRTVLVDLLAARTGNLVESEVFMPEPLLLDLSGVTFAASAALSLLLELDARASAGLVPLVLVVPAGSFLDRLLDRCGLSDTLTLAASADAARRHWDAPSTNQNARGGRRIGST